MDARPLPDVRIYGGAEKSHTALSDKKGAESGGVNMVTVKWVACVKRRTRGNDFDGWKRHWEGLKGGEEVATGRQGHNSDVWDGGENVRSARVGEVLAALVGNGYDLQNAEEWTQRVRGRYLLCIGPCNFRT
jgi:hypothetical protein